MLLSSNRKKYLILFLVLEAVLLLFLRWKNFQIHEISLYSALLLVSVIALYYRSQKKYIIELSAGKLREIQNKFDFLNENIPGVFCRWNQYQNGNIIFSYLSTAFREIFKVKEETKTKNHAFLRMEKNDLDTLETKIKAGFETEKNWLFEGHSLIDDEDIYWIISARLLQIEKGQTVFDCVMTDASELKRMEENLKHKEERFQKILENMPVLINAFDDKGNVIVWNKEFERITGYTSFEISENPSLIKKVFNHNDFFSYARSKKFSGDLFRGVEFDINCKDGTRRTIKWSRISANVPIPEWSTWIIGFDITHERVAEEALWRRDLLLGAASQIGHILLGSSDQEKMIEQVFSLIGPVVDADRVYVFENHDGPGGEHLTSQRYEWINRMETNVKNRIDLENISYKKNFPRWYKELSAGNSIKGNINDLPYGEQGFLKSQNVASILLAPIIINGNFWGFIGFDECKNPREWTDNEEVILGMVGSAIGNFIMRCRAEIYLAQAKQKAEMIAQQAKAATQAKSEFLANVSHDIRTPLNGIIGMAQMLAKTNMDEKQNEYVKDLLKSGELLASIISDVLDFSKIESGKLELETASFNVKEIIDNLFKVLKYQADKKDLEFILNYKNDFGTDEVKGDSVRLRQVLMNLLSNSIKFTFKGRIELNVFADKKGESPDVLDFTFEVYDTGIGIPQDKIEKVFEKFMQADTSTTRKFGGTGLGLSICKAIVEKMGGTISVQSEINQGSIFRFKIPLHINSSSISSSEENKFVQLNWKRQPRILLVDDSLINRKIAEAFISHAGCLTDYAENGRIALEMFSKKDYDLVFMDLQMPEMDGIEATIHIKKVEIQKNINTPVIAMTANALQSEREKCISVGMDEYLTKPIHENKLRKILSQALEHLLVKTESAPEKEQEEVAAHEELSVFEAEKALDFLGGNKRLLIEMLKVFIAEAPEEIRNLRAKAAGLDIQAILRSAHKLKGESASICAYRFSKISAEMEAAAKEDNTENIQGLMSSLEKAFMVLSSELKKYLSQ